MELVMTRKELRDLLYEVWLKSNYDFSGIGLVVFNDTADLPIINLQSSVPEITGTLTEVLSNISSKKSKYHDGFHFLNKKGELIFVAQYFSPPIVRAAYFDRSRFVGGRFVAALFGSYISGVIRTGIVSERHLLSIFENGQEIHFEELQ